MDADHLDGVGQVDLRTRHGEAFGRESLGDVARADRAVELAGLTRLADDDDGLAVEAARDARGGFTTLGVALFDRGTLGLEALAVGLGGAQRLVLGEKEV